MITQAQHDKSLHDLTVKIGYGEINSDLMECENGQTNNHAVYANVRRWKNKCRIYR